jgi:hypothetical protein
MPLSEIKLLSTDELKQEFDRMFDVIYSHQRQGLLPPVSVGRFRETMGFLSFILDEILINGRFLGDRSPVNPASYPNYRHLPASENLHVEDHPTGPSRKDSMNRRILTQFVRAFAAAEDKGPETLRNFCDHLYGGRCVDARLLDGITYATTLEVTFSDCMQQISGDGRYSYFSSMANALQPRNWSRAFSKDRVRNVDGVIDEKTLFDDEKPVGVAGYLKNVLLCKLDNTFLDDHKSVPVERLPLFFDAILNEEKFIHTLQFTAAEQRKFEELFFRPYGGELALLAYILSKPAYHNRLAPLLLKFSFDRSMNAIADRWADISDDVKIDMLASEWKLTTHCDQTKFESLLFSTAPGKPSLFALVLSKPAHHDRLPFLFRNLSPAKLMEVLKEVWPSLSDAVRMSLIENMEGEQLLEVVTAQKDQVAEFNRATGYLASRGAAARDLASEINRTSNSRTSWKSDLPLLTELAYRSALCVDRPNADANRNRYPVLVDRVASHPRLGRVASACLIFCGVLLLAAAIIATAGVALPVAVGTLVGTWALGGGATGTGVYARSRSGNYQRVASSANGFFRTLPVAPAPAPAPAPAVPVAVPRPV